MSVDQAKAVVAERTKPQDQWKGPTNGPKAAAGDVTVVYTSRVDLPTKQAPYKSGSPLPVFCDTDGSKGEPK
jgi:hypothetical protein